MSSRENGLAAAHQANAIAPTKLTEKEAKEIAEYEKILRFRDAVLSGEHPTIKIQGNVALSSKATRAPSEPGEVDAKSQAPKPSFTSTQKQNPSLPPHLADAGAKPADSEIPRPFGAGAGVGVGAATTQINPIFLEKSDELVRAEIQLQRQRLERALREELENHRNTRHAEPVIEFDLSDVLAKALTLVQASATPFAANRGLTANSASDSFDDRTYYSSQHETPDSNLTSRVRRSTDEGMMMVDGRRESQSGPRQTINSGSHVAATARDYPAAGSSSQPFYQAPGPVANATPSRPEKQQVPGLHHLHVDSGSLPAPHAPAIAAIATGAEANRTAERGHQGPENSVPEPAQNQSGQPLPPLIRNHDLVPIAPQPAKIAPLTVVNVQTPVAETVVPAPLAVPAQAQVAALRNEAPAAAVSDSSSQGTKEADQRKKKKKRKVERQAPEAEASPRIKVEPRSQSPVTAPAYTRPSKRQRQSQVHANESERPEPRHIQPPSNASYERQPSQVYRGERAPVTYQAPEPRRIILRHAQATEPAAALNYDRDFIDDRLASGEGFIRLPHSGEHYVRREYARETDALDRARHGTIVREPYVISEGPYREPARVYHEPLEAPRASVRPEGESFIVPPRPPTRVMVDSYGREYIEPALSSARQSVAPLPRSGEPEVIYERLPPTQPLSGHPGAGVPYNESGVVYTRPLSVYDPVNRVYVSQPPESPYDHRDGQYREHQLQQRGYIQLSGPHDRRIVEERPIEYASRPVGYQASDRVRLEPTGQPYYRMHSIHPDASGREATSASTLRYDSRRPEGPQPYVREYLGSPMQRHPTVHREYSVRPPERFQGPPAPARGSNEIAFIEQPRAATREIVYVDDVRREVYR
ncbi:hypothetical protein TGAM01_v201831 [Trichoderma gamsii]|uniref:Uncharacterized protein n=1 Tax=Trichoderma gamsii TaxID=398673 RepID=A0A2P4ZZ55_9HYPO|nr:hypothetical protein TGAM01_v201831 [Trichoderma gamsii]PON29582.1 hypothetical protein TGAM01_v201831 [Trichoderma gamsii]